MKRIIGSEDLQYLMKLENDVNTILVGAKKERHNIDGAVNWADLRCVSTEFYVAGNGDHGYRAYIEEASSTAAGLHTYVYRKLAERGYKAVEIRTAW